ncbi:MAG TPA: hypothetical protein VJ783_25400 [Pirellulales bacterium]|nr:hypothetical protein [Pirellulales bacterium]
MTFILVPASGEDIVINGWNWRPIVAALVRAGILTVGERQERCLAQGCGGYITASEALQAAEHIDALICGMQPNQRLLRDGELTDKVIDYNLPISDWDDAETWQRYSARHDVLKEFAAFCRRSGGFDVV